MVTIPIPQPVNGRPLAASSARMHHHHWHSSPSRLPTAADSAGNALKKWGFLRENITVLGPKRPNRRNRWSNRACKSSLLRTSGSYLKHSRNREMGDFNFQNHRNAQTIKLKCRRVSNANCKTEAAEVFVRASHHDSSRRRRCRRRCSRCYFRIFWI